MNILALDTAYSRVSACLISGSDIFYADSDDCKPSSVALAPKLAELVHQAGLQWDELDAFAMGHGPGSFTGLRIGAASIAGLNSGLHRPVLPISSLAITALQTGMTEPLYVLEDARAGEAFMGRYQAGLALQPDRLHTLQEMNTLAPGLYAGQSTPPVASSGWQRIPLTIARDKALALTVQQAVPLIDDWKQCPAYPQPVYMQPSQAERNARV